MNGVVKKQKLNLDLFEPCKRGDITLLKERLEAGADPNIQDMWGDTVLVWASCYGYIGCVELLLKDGADPNLQNSWGETALYLVTRKGHADCVELLLKNGADSDIQNEDGYTALSWACRNGYAKCTELLLKYGVNFKTRFTALEMVALDGHIVCVEILKNWKTYLPPWNRYTTAKYYPIEFNEIAFAWLSRSKLPKDLRYLVLPKIAEEWKLN